MPYPVRRWKPITSDWRKQPGRILYDISVGEVAISASDSLAKVHWAVMRQTESTISIVESAAKMSWKWVTESAISATDIVIASIVRIMASEIFEVAISVSEALLYIGKYTGALIEDSISVADSIASIRQRIMTLAESAISATDGVAASLVRIIARDINETTISAIDSVVSLYWGIRAITETAISVSELVVIWWTGIINKVQPRLVNVNFNRLGVVGNIMAERIKIVRNRWSERWRH